MGGNQSQQEQGTRQRQKPREQGREQRQEERGGSARPKEEREPLAPLSEAEKAQLRKAHAERESGGVDLLATFVNGSVGLRALVTESNLSNAVTFLRLPLSPKETPTLKAYGRLYQMVCKGSVRQRLEFATELFGSKDGVLRAAVEIATFFSLSLTSEMEEYEKESNEAMKEEVKEKYTTALVQWSNAESRSYNDHSGMEKREALLLHSFVEERAHRLFYTIDLWFTTVLLHLTLSELLSLFSWSHPIPSLVSRQLFERQLERERSREDDSIDGTPADNQTQALSAELPTLAKTEEVERERKRERERREEEEESLPLSPHCSLLGSEGETAMNRWILSLAFPSQVDLTDVHSAAQSDANQSCDVFDCRGQPTNGRGAVTGGDGADAWILLYNSEADGGSISKFKYSVMGYTGSTVVVVELEAESPRELSSQEEEREVRRGDLMGAFLGCKWRNDQVSYFGNSECFLFNLRPCVTLYSTGGYNQNYVDLYDHQQGHQIRQQEEEKGVGFGGRKKHYRLAFDSSMKACHKTDMDSTYMAGPLGDASVFSMEDDGSFPIRRVEVYGVGGKRPVGQQNQARIREGHLVDQARKVNRQRVFAATGQDAMNNTDRLIMDMAGITGHSNNLRDEPEPE